MKYSLKVAAILPAFATINFHSPKAFAQGSLTPPGMPSPTMKMLAQIRPRAPIAAPPFTINQPGFCRVTTNPMGTGGDYMPKVAPRRRIVKVNLSRDAGCPPLQTTICFAP